MGREDIDDGLILKWAKAVKVRDNFACQVCDERGYVESHHLMAYEAYPDLRYDLENGVTLCKDHHHKFHQSFGYGKNTKWQFEQFLKIVNIFEKLITSDKPPNFLSNDY